MIPGLFSYYGGKHQISGSYPDPLHDTIVEPFAGSAGYAHRHHAKKVILIERDPVVAELWRWLIAANPSDVLALPLVEPGQDIRTMGLDRPVESLIGFWCNPGTSSPRRRLTSWALAKPNAVGFWSSACRQRIATHIDKVDHWTIIEGDYMDAPDMKATWFVDPPYQSPVGSQYKYRDLNYDYLGMWCRSLRGQVMVCETEGAEWLPFVRHRRIGGQKRKSVEVAWTNKAAE